MLYKNISSTYEIQTWCEKSNVVTHIKVEKQLYTEQKYFNESILYPDI